MAGRSRRRAGGDVEPRGVWAYAVAGRDLAPAVRVTGVGGGPVRTVAAAGLTTVAEDVPLAEFGEESLRRHLEDLAWLETAARAHHRVIDAVAQQGPLVPMQFATVYEGDAGLVAMLEERAPDLRAVLRRVSGRREWGVKLYPARQPEPGDAGGDAAAPTGPGAGAAYLRRRRDQLASQKETRRDTLTSAEAIHAELSRHAACARLYPPQAPQLTGSQAPTVLNAAYLVDEEREGGFAAIAASLAERHPGVRLELSGPWPPYSFAGAEERRAR
jgi:hypothetical protein